MRFKLQDFRCKSCKEITEILLDKSEENQEISCPKCNSKELEPVLGVGQSGSKHSSWSKWQL